MSEVQHRRPVIRLVLLESARCAGRLLGDVNAIFHGKVERILRGIVSTASDYAHARRDLLLQRLGASEARPCPE